jgi:hypothetical protein
VAAVVSDQFRHGRTLQTATEITGGRADTDRQLCVHVQFKHCCLFSCGAAVGAQRVPRR